jgi:hypothetical protein
MTCEKCKGTSWLMYVKDAPSPPYKEGSKLDYGVRCPNCNGASRYSQNSSDRATDI